MSELSVKTLLLNERKQIQYSELRMKKKKVRPLRISLPVLGIGALIALVAVGSLLSRTQGPLTFNGAPILTPAIAQMDELSQFEVGRPVPDPDTVRSVPPVTSDDHLRGDRSAPVTIIEYASLTNSYASVMQPELAKFISGRKKIVSLVYRHFPLQDDRIDWELAMASECVARIMGPDRFWRFIDAAYRIEAGPDAIERTLAEAGLKNEDIKSCAETQEAALAVTNHRDPAMQSASIIVLPTFIVVNNATGEQRFVDGAVTTGFLQSVVDAAQ